MPAERLILLGVNHKTAPVHIREKLALTHGYEEPLQVLKQLSGCRELYLLSTCNRVELLFVAEKNDELEQRVFTYLAGDDSHGVSLKEYFYIYYDEDAVQHLFKVAASLDSMIVGEAQILGQIKDAYRHAAAAGSTGPLLNRLLHKSFSVAKRVRSETGIGSFAVSISYAAVQLARKIFGSLQDKKVLVIGAGEMAELAVEHLIGQGIAEIIVANRTLSRAMELASRFGGRAVALAELPAQLELVDIVISSTGASGDILSKDDVRPIMRIRRNRALFFIDIAVPRDLDPELSTLDNVFLYDIDDLKTVVALNKNEREKEAVKASRIVEEETYKFSKWRESLRLNPTIRALHEKVDTICEGELERSCMKMAGRLDSEEREQLEKMVHAIAAKILYDPLQYLKNQECGRSDQSRIHILRTIFKLDK